jgi:hypothetical protein
MRFRLPACALALSFVLPGASVPVRVPVWLQGEGQLTAKQLKATMDGAASAIVDVRGPADDLMVLLVLDMVGDLASIEPAKEALIGALATLPPSTHVGVLRAQDGLRVLVDPTPDRERVTQAIRDNAAAGTAGLLENVELMGRIASGILLKTGVRVAVFYVTDSTVHNYRQDFTNPVINSSDAHDLSRRFPEQLIQEKVAKVENNLAKQQAPLFIVHLDYRNDRMNEAYQIGLKRLAETTGGAAEFCRSRSEIPKAIARTWASIQSHYSVAIAAPSNSPRTVQLELTAAGNPALAYRTRLVLKER